MGALTDMVTRLMKYSALCGALAFAAFAFLFGTGEAEAQTAVCSDTPGAGERIRCTEGAGSMDDIRIDARNVAIQVTGTRIRGVFGRHDGSGDIDIDLTGGSVTTSGTHSYGVGVGQFGASGAIDIGLKDVVVKTSGTNAWGVVGDRTTGTGTIDIDVQGGSIEVAGPNSIAVHALQRSSGDIDIDVTDTVLKAVFTSLGIYALRSGAAGDIAIGVRGGSIETNTFTTHGIYARAQFTDAADEGGDIEVTVADTSVTNKGAFSYGVFAEHLGRGGITVDVSGGSVMTSEGRNGFGVYAHHGKRREVTGTDTTVDMTIGAGTRVRAPFGNGVYGQLSFDNVAGVAISHAGAIEARDSGILAWASLASGLVRGDGSVLQLEDHTGKRQPMIHVVSSGDVTVGAGVADAYIREVVTGTDGALSAAERAVLDAILAEDSDALDTALAALPAAYTDAWKLRARDFLSARGLETTDIAASIIPGSVGRPGNAFIAGEVAAREILGIPRAGIRAMAISHQRIAEYIQWADPDDTDPNLSAAERRVLEAVLTGGSLEAALAALPVSYADSYKGGVRLRATFFNEGDIRVDVTGGTIVSDGDGVHARYVLTSDRNGAISVTVAEGASVTGERNGIYVGSAGAGEGSFRAQSVTVNGQVTGGSGAGVHMAGGGRLTVGAGGRVDATSGVGVLSDGPGDLAVTVAGRVEGDIRVTGTGTLTLAVPEGGVVTGMVRDPVGLSTLAGSIGRLLYSGGATVTVAPTGALTGVEVEGGTEALRSEDGDLDVTVAGRVAGDLRAPPGGTLTLAVPEGGVVTGTAHDPVGPLTVAGSIGRLLYTSGATVTVAPTGALTGVESDDRTEALRSEDGALHVTVAGRVAGDLRPPRDGTLTLAVPEGGVITGTVHDPVGPLTVAGNIGRLLYTNGATVTVPATGALTGVAVDGRTEALRSEAGDLAVFVAGRVAGDVLGLGTGDHKVTVARGGTVTGTIRLAASTVTVDGAVGGVRLDRGGTVTVGRTGRIAGIEGVGIRSETGDLSATVAGVVDGDVLALGSGEHRVTVAAGGAVTGTVRVATENAVTVEGTAGRVRLDHGGMVTVGKDGRVTGLAGDDDTLVIHSESGELAVLIRQADGETVTAAAGRVEGRIEEAGGTPEVSFQPAGATEPLALGAPGTKDSVPAGAFDVGVVADGGGVRLDRDYAPRARVYEVLPSVLLGLNGLSGFRARMEAPRSPNGVWARAEASGGSREAKRSTSASRLSWTHRRHGVETGVDIPVEPGVLMGVSAHHRRGSADVSGEAGGIDVSGNGLGASMALRLVDGMYLDGRASATWYEARLRSGPRGSLKRDAKGLGHAVGLEVGRRLGLGRGALGEWTLTPRARVVHSRVDVEDFTDRVGSRVSLDEGHATTGRAGVRVEASDHPGGSRLFGSVDVEHELSPETRVRVSGTALRSEAETTRLHVVLGGVAEWGEGRYALQGVTRYATGARDYGGGLALKLRF